MSKTNEQKFNEINEIIGLGESYATFIVSTDKEKVAGMINGDGKELLNILLIAYENDEDIKNILNVFTSIINYKTYAKDDKE